jgi:hypothetical protein
MRWHRVVGSQHHLGSREASKERPQRVLHHEHDARTQADKSRYIPHELQRVAQAVVGLHQDRLARAGTRRWSATPKPWSPQPQMGVEVGEATTIITACQVDEARMVACDRVLGRLSTGLFERTLPTPSPARAYKGQSYLARVADGALVLNGTRFDSPSAAAMSITKHPVNGWTFWQCRLPGQGRWTLFRELRMSRPDKSSQA